MLCFRATACLLQQQAGSAHIGSGLGGVWSETQQVQRKGAQRDDYNCICRSGNLGPANGSCKIKCYLVFHGAEGKD